MKRIHAYKDSAFFRGTRNIMYCGMTIRAIVDNGKYWRYSGKREEVTCKRCRASFNKERRKLEPKL